MKVTFIRTGERRYRITVEGKGVVTSFMEPAAGYDARLPHDIAHFVVESYLGLTGGIFGRLAAGGHGFRPMDVKNNRKGIKQRDHISPADRAEAELSERVIDIACRKWKGETYSGAPAKGITDEDIAEICREYDKVSAMWSTLPVGGALIFEWKPKLKPHSASRRR